MRTNRLIQFLSMLFVVLTFGATSAKADGGTPFRIVIPRETAACIQDCMSSGASTPSDVTDCRVKLKSCKDLNTEWNEAYNALAKICGAAEAHGAPPAKPVKKAVVGPKPDDTPKPTPPPVVLVVCDAPATANAAKTGCVCPAGVPVREIDSREGGNIKYGTCVPSLKMFTDLVDQTNRRFTAICRPGTEQANLDDNCTQAGADLNEVVIWYRSLITPPAGSTTPALNWASWDELNRRVANIWGGMEVLCPAIQGKPNATMAERCTAAKAGEKVHEDKQDADIQKALGMFPGGLHLQLPFAGGVNIRPDPGTDTIFLELRPTLLGLFTETDGMYISGGIGGGWNRDANRLVTGAGVGWYHALDTEREVAFMLGAHALVEPSVRGNDAFGIGPAVGFQFKPGGGHFLLDLHVEVGGNRTWVYGPGGQGRPSDVGVYFAPSAALGCDW